MKERISKSVLPIMIGLLIFCTILVLAAQADKDQLLETVAKTEDGETSGGAGENAGMKPVAITAGEVIHYITTDHLGSVRVVTDENGVVVSRHDYLPFGEEIPAGLGVRTAQLGYNQLDGIRQKFTGYQRDNENGLDFAQARYYGAVSGRFTSPDPLLASGSYIDPQSWNRYTYCMNNPLVYTDPTGTIWGYSSKQNLYQWFEGNEVPEGWTAVPIGTTYISEKGDRVLLGVGGQWANLGYAGPVIDFQHGLGSDFAAWYVRFAAEEFIGNLTGAGIVKLFEAYKALRLASTGARELAGSDFEAAEIIYEAIRQSTDDIAAIAKNTGMKQSQIARIKDHIFNKSHILDDGVRRFDADPEIVNAWKRLENGSHTQKDIQLLKHELFESRFEGIFKTDYRKAHGAANRSGRPSGLE
jgi:RHS repeat-associated protein